MADRCYLAVGGDELNQEESELASQLNIGLIQVKTRPQTCEIVLPSPQYRPLRAQKLELIRNLNYVECVLCATLRDRDKMINHTKDAIGIAARQGRGFRYRLRDAAEDSDQRRYICSDCVRALNGL